MKRPRVERVELARLLGELGKLGSNVNQIAKAFNSTGAIPNPAGIDGDADRHRGDTGGADAA